MKVDPFTVAYISGAGVLISAELAAVFRKQQGDTITEKVKRSPLLHATMTSLLTWGLVHFTADPADVATNLGIVVAGAALGVAASRARSAARDQ